eukprot:1190513-Prorocentrum_minimum.AAC.3
MDGSSEEPELEGIELHSAAYAGGARRCEYEEGCNTAPRGSTRYCLAHDGGGKRCAYEGCT